MAMRFFNVLRLAAASLIILALAAGTAFPGSAAASEADENIFVYADGAPHVMKRVTSSSGERYEDPEDPSTFFWSEGGDAVLSVGGRKHERFVLARGLDDEDKFTLTVDGKNYEMNHVISASGAKYEAEGDPSTVFWSKGASVTLTVGGQEYEGYDLWLPSGDIWLAGQDIPTGIEWRVKSVTGYDIVSDSPVTISFNPDGTLSGKAQVNNYRSSWITLGSRIIIGRVASTMTAGPPDLMERENIFLRLLPEAERYKLVRDGLVLVTRSGAEIILTQ
jgi:heat shock protein HslJ/membrane-bound inhibitor of C-type lysozyme